MQKKHWHQRYVIGLSYSGSKFGFCHSFAGASVGDKAYLGALARCKGAPLGSSGLFVA